MPELSRRNVEVATGSGPCAGGTMFRWLIPAADPAFVGFRNIHLRRATLVIVRTAKCLL
jgi:hypothetical protein